MNDKLLPNETLLQGKSRFLNDKFVIDEIVSRIDFLTENVLKEIANNNCGEWTWLYLDESDGRYWELFYPEADWKDNGPPSLRHISEEEARKKYKF